MDIKNNVAIITGGASGLGAETAKYLAAKGAKVAIFDLDIGNAKNLAKQLNGIAVQVDICSEESVTQALNIVKDELGGIRMLVNCAGIGNAGRVLGREGPLDLAEFSKVISVNLIGTFNMIRLVGAEMNDNDILEDAERGVIVSTASIAAYDGQIGQAAYAASKGALVSLTLPIAREFSRIGVRVNTIAPGIFHTPMVDTLPEAAQKSIAASIPFPSRLGKPSEFASLVVTCIENNYLNGETIRLDGAVRLAPK